MTVTPETVRDLLHSEDFGERLRAVNLIRQLDPAIAFDLIQIAVADRNARVRYAGVSQLASVGGVNLEQSLAILRDRLVNDSEADVQAAAADALGALKLTAAFDDLKTLFYQTDQWLVQFSIVAALGELGDPRGVELLEAALQSDIELVRTAAVGSLGELGDERSLPLLLPFAADPDWQIRYRVAQALGRLQTPDARAALEELSHDSMAAVADAARQELAL